MSEHEEPASAPRAAEDSPGFPSIGGGRKAPSTPPGQNPPVPSPDTPSVPHSPSTSKRKPPEPSHGFVRAKQPALAFAQAMAEPAFGFSWAVVLAAVLKMGAPFALSFAQEILNRLGEVWNNPDVPAE